MARSHKIVWSEGMFLGPHHFQQLDRYYESLLNSRVKSVEPLYWGLMDMEINREGLENGTFMLLSCHGIFPGGSYINIPETDDPPPSRAIEEHFSPSLESLGVYLAIPTDRPGSINYRLEGDEGLGRTRYFRDFVQVVDENTGDNEREIPVARKVLKILFADESLDENDYLKIAELERTSSGVVTLKDDYIPPCVSISASQQLVRIVRRLMELLTAKSDEIREQCRQKADGSYEFGAADMANLWPLQTISSFIPELNHFYSTGRGHPEHLFRLLARFAGSLTAFSARVRSIGLPTYSHDDLSNCFGELDRVIRELLQMIGVTPTVEYVLIPLREVRESVYEAALEDYLLTPSYRFHLAVRGGSQEDLITEFPRQVKVASPNEIDLLIGRALRGISLNYSPSPPKAIPRRSGHFYFTLDARSDFWRDVQQSKSLAIYVPSLFAGLELEFMAVEE